MTKKKIFVIGIAILLITVIALAVYVFSNINEKPPIVVEQSASSVTDKVVEKNEDAVVFNSTFKGVDDIHWGRGSVQVIQTTNGPTLSFADDFEAAPGPDLFVYLSPNEAGQELGQFASLGTLKAGRGAQSYTLPEDYASYKTVVIWCRAFSATFATAELR